MRSNWPCRTSGNKKQPALVFLHGFLGNAADWDFLTGDFEQDYYCIVPDLPGHGENLGNLPALPVTFDWMSRGLAHTLEALEISRTYLVGYSLGGRLALYFTYRYPTKVRSLILESASPGLSGRVERWERRLMDAQRAQEITSLGLDAFIERWYEMPLFTSLQSKPELLANLKMHRRQNDPVEIARILSELSPGRQPSLWSKLPQILTPALLLAGSLDAKYLRLVQRMAALIPTSKIALAPDTGHNIHLEAPEWTISAIKSFYTRANASYFPSRAKPAKTLSR